MIFSAGADFSVQYRTDCVILDNEYICAASGTLIGGAALNTTSSAGRRRPLGTRGWTEWIFVVLALAILAMVVVILVPVFRDASQSVKRGVDDRAEQTAEDSARMAYAGGSAFTAVYDTVNKQFVSIDEASRVEPYGECAEHKGMVIVVTADDDGSVTMFWTRPEELS